MWICMRFAGDAGTSVKIRERAVVTKDVEWELVIRVCHTLHALDTNHVTKSKDIYVVTNLRKNKRSCKKRVQAHVCSSTWGVDVGRGRERSCAREEELYAETETRGTALCGCVGWSLKGSSSLRWAANRQFSRVERFPEGALGVEAKIASKSAFDEVEGADVGE
ncbi:hypothetical protein ARMGADRAFT_639533 [Armillaria gallica]|uniref:Uncharacterized protein n=1 Tax=Armillaria gallica TaxID=47427 RepID=A0A2H3EA44_ARMGA|nr:hypothetical protein ARMGADRAFT_639533 [Armillaria gallica]